MPKRPAGKKAATSSAPLPTQQNQTLGDISENDSRPPVATNEAPTESQVNEAPMPDPGLLVPDDGWERGKKEVYLLENGATLIARSEVEAGAYANKGGKLVDVIYDE